MKIVQVKDSPSVEPQEVPGFPVAFPVALNDYPASEAELRRQIKDSGAPLEIVERRGAAAKTVDVPDPSDASSPVGEAPLPQDEAKEA